jgi:CheY-like chemotaxis protein
MSTEDKVSLLIVEDDPNLRYLLEAAAHRSEGFTSVVMAEDGAIALSHLQRTAGEQLPDLIISDLSMPHMTGLELVRAVKADARLAGIPIAILTSSDLPHDRTNALAAGACEFMSKPHGLDALMRTLVGLRDTCAAKASAACSGGVAR